MLILRRSLPILADGAVFSCHCAVLPQNMARGLSSGRGVERKAFVFPAQLRPPALEGGGGHAQHLGSFADAFVGGVGLLHVFELQFFQLDLQAVALVGGEAVGICGEQDALQIALHDGIALGGDQNPLNAVFQFSDIAGPLVVIQDAEGQRGHALVKAKFPVGLGEKGADQWRDVSRPLPQRRDLDGHGIDPIEQV